jgi:hypothetical protein
MAGARCCLVTRQRQFAMARADLDRTDSTAHRYGDVAIGLHWLLALAILGSLSVGFYMHGLPLSPLRLRLFNWHKWAGITILALSLLRLGWRWTHPAPPLPGPVARSMPAWQRLAHHGTHAALNLLFSPCRCRGGRTARRPAFRSSGSACWRCRTGCRSIVKVPRPG